VGEIPLPDREQRNNETDILGRALVALNRVPGVRVSRNNVGQTPARQGQRPVRYGLGNGSPDVVGIYSLALESGAVVALAFGLEFKKPGSRTAKRHWEEQQAWMHMAGRRGMKCAVVTSEEEAVSSLLSTIRTWRSCLSANGLRLSDDA
jgi:hypothetical protein